MPRTFLTAEWRKLVMAQYEVEPSSLLPWLPRGVEIDLFQGCCYVSLVGFLFDRVRLKRLAIPFHTQFEEVNLRFYVTRTERNGDQKRGVVFIREFVPRAAITFVARIFYEEPYSTMPMHHAISTSSGRIDVSYSWRHRDRWHSLAVEAALTQESIAPGSQEEFLTEHYWGYTRRSRGSASEYGVEHPRWKTYPIRNFRVDADFDSLYGRAFATLNGATPVSVLLAEGSAVRVLGGTRLIDQ